jgi:hypothetical protein
MPGTQAGSQNQKNQNCIEGTQIATPANGIALKAIVPEARNARTILLVSVQRHFFALGIHEGRHKGDLAV